MVAEYGNQETFCKMAVSKEYTDIVPHKVQPCFHHAFTIIPHEIQWLSFYQVPSIKCDRMAVRITLISFHICHHVYYYQSRLARIVSPRQEHWRMPRPICQPTSKCRLDLKGSFSFNRIHIINTALLINFAFHHIFAKVYFSSISFLSFATYDDDTSG